MPHIATDLLAAAQQSPTQAVAKVEKHRQKLLNERYTRIYVYLAAGILGFFVVRNVLLSLLGALDRRRRRTLAETCAEKAAEKPTASESYAKRSRILRLSDRLDEFSLRRVPGLGPSWTFIRVFLVALIVGINVAFSLVGSTHLHSPQNAYSSIARAFSRRCGRMAVANYPFLFCFAGRNGIMVRLTGFSYQTLRFYHILLGVIAFILSFVHTFAYIAHYTVWQGASKLAEEFTEKYFKWGIVALVFLLVNCAFGLKWLRRRAYETFLTLHIIGAALILAGTWYHRPVAIPWVYAAIAVWVFDRLVRAGHHIASYTAGRVSFRRPIVKARASVVAGAIKLTVPVPGQTWTAGQHCYISFFSGLGMIRRPWYCWQSHPFSIANMPSEVPEEREMHFVLRIHHGVTTELARHIEKRARATGTSEVECSISLDGPYGSPPAVADFDQLLLLAGGSGITHTLSVLDHACREALAGRTALRTCTLIWAVQEEAHLEWAHEDLVAIERLAEKAQIPVDVRLFVTRGKPGQASPALSLASGDDEKDWDALRSSTSASRPLRFNGRPDAETEVTVAAAKGGRTLVVACGPARLARDAARGAEPFLGKGVVQLDIAHFEC